MFVSGSASDHEYGLAQRWTWISPTCLRRCFSLHSPPSARFPSSPPKPGHQSGDAGRGDPSLMLPLLSVLSFLP